MTTINNALSGVLAAQAALDATSQNVANVVTPGYSRQGVLLATTYQARAGVNPGNGVAVNSLIRFSDSYKSHQMWLAASNLGQYKAAQSYLTQLEQVMGDDTANINAGLDNFFGALNAASVEPTSTPLRQQVIADADALTKRFNSLRQLLSTQRQSVQQQRSAIVEQINEKTTAIAALNRKIAEANAMGSVASGLIDERDLAIDKLSDLVGLQVVDQKDGTRSVSLRNGQPLVVGSLASTLTVTSDATGAQTLQLKFATQTMKIVDNDLGGQLGGIGSFENDVLLPLINATGDMAGGLAAMFNAQLAAGFDMHGNSGAPLFIYDPSSSNSMLSINSALTAADLAFSSDATKPGNSGNLLALINLKNQSVSVGHLGSTLLGDAYTQLVGTLGTTSQANQASQTTAQTVRDQAEESWKSTSGVNSDEEASNLIQFKQMYEANMKVIAVVNQLFDATLSMFG